MLSPHQMSSVIITGPNSVQENVIKELHKLKVLHIVEHSKNELADIGKPLESASRLSDTLVKIRALISALNIKKEEDAFELKRNLLEIESTTKKISQEVNLNSEGLRKTEELLSRNESVKQELEVLKNVDVPLEFFTSYKSLVYFTGFIKDKGREAFKDELEEITGRFAVFESAADKRGFIALFVDAKSKEQAGNILQKNGFSPVNFASIANLRGNASSNLKKIEEESLKLQKKKDEIKKRIERTGQDYNGFLAAADNFLGEQLEKAEAPLKFASTPSSFLAKGWIPAEELSASIERLNKAANNKIFVHFEPANKQDKVPVKLKNPNYAKAFEFFIDLYSMPTYREIDPTFFIFLTFPIFFGIMLGDIGYGLASLLFFWILKSKMPKAKNFLNILMLASFVSILFGFLYGEFFGLEEVAGFQLWHLLSRVHDMFTLLYISVAIGIVHINIGLVAGFINELKSHGFMHAVYTKISWFILEIGILTVALSIFKIIAFSLFGLSSVYIPFIGPITMATFVGILIIILSLSMLFKGEGIQGPMESISILTNTMSYSRLMAIGLSSVVLAVIINDSAKQFFNHGGFYILIGILIVVVGHVINIMLGLLGSFLHSLRLHYVEFFSKFFHGGAEKYQPFGMKDD